MAFVDFSAHSVRPYVAPQAAAGTAAPAASGAADDDSYSFDDLLDVVNPLQHIPVVSTLYRAITGDTIKTLPKIAGDALYGGLTGLAGSVADTVFEKITGKSVGDTVLAFAENLFSPDDPAQLKMGDGPRVAALSLPALPAPTVPTTPGGQDAITVASGNALDGNAIVVPGQEALLLALGRNGVDQDTALRASAAYQRAVTSPSDSGVLHGSLN